MKTVIFGGTSEGRELSCELAKAGAEVLVSVASEVGVEEQGTTEGVTVEWGVKDEDGIRDMIRGTDLVIDATHPFAVVVTDNIRKAAEAESVERLRLLRGKSVAAGGDGSEEAGIPHRNIIAVQGPFSEELNRAVIHEYEINVMVTKDSGAAGGYPEKISAARDCRIPVIVITRPEEDGLSFDEILAVCREKLR